MPWDQAVSSIERALKSEPSPIEENIKGVGVSESAEIDGVLKKDRTFSGKSQQGRSCPGCGSRIPDNFNFCGRCGTRFSAIEMTEQAKIMQKSPQSGSLDSCQPPIIRLVLIKPDGSDGAATTMGSNELLMGRTKGLILLNDDRFVSPLHARFVLDSGGVLKVYDEQSLNGVYIRIKGECELSTGGFFRIGRQVLRYDDAASIEGLKLQPVPGDDAVVLGSHDVRFWGRLVQIMEGARIGRVFLLSGQDAAIGREKGEIIFPGDAFMSSMHARISMKGGRAFLKDLGSSNKTYIKIKDQMVLASGDVLLVGNKLIKIDIR